MNESEYREVEARLDEALMVFNDNRVLLAPEERRTYENLLAARKETHGLRIEQESESVA